MRPKAALPSFGRSSDKRETAAAGGRGVEREQQSEGTVKKHSPKISDVCGGTSSSSSSSGDTSDLLINTSAKRSRDGSKKDAQQAGSANALDHDADLSSIHTNLANRGTCDGIFSSDEPTLKRMRTASGRDGEAGQGMTADLSGPAAKLKDTDKGKLAISRSKSLARDISLIAPTRSACWLSQEHGCKSRRSRAHRVRRSDNPRDQRFLRPLLGHCAICRLRNGYVIEPAHAAGIRCVDPRRRDDVPACYQRHRVRR